MGSGAEQPGLGPRASGSAQGERRARGDLRRHPPPPPLRPAPPPRPPRSPLAPKVDLQLRPLACWASLHGQVPGLLDWDLGNECFLAFTTTHLPSAQQNRECPVRAGWLRSPHPARRPGASPVPHATGPAAASRRRQAHGGRRGCGCGTWSSGSTRPARRRPRPPAQNLLAAFSPWRLSVTPGRTAQFTHLALSRTATYQGSWWLCPGLLGCLAPTGVPHWLNGAPWGL